MIKTILLATILSFQSKSDTIPLVDSNMILEKIQILMDSSEFDQSIELLQAVSRYDSNYLEVQRQLIKCYSGKKEIDEVRNIANSLTINRKVFPAIFYVTLGNAYLNNDLPKEGINTYREGLKHFPYNTSLNYNIGYAEYSQENYEAAIPHFIETLKINPYFSQAHLLLGNVMSRTNQRTKSVLSYLTYLALNPDQNWAVVRLNQLVNDGYSEEGSLQVSLDNSALKYYDNILRSKAALNKRYKSEIDFQAPVAQQSEFLVNSLKYKKGTNDFWMEFYVPYFESMAQENLTKAFVYFILSSTNNENVLKGIKKSKKQQGEWVIVAQNHLDQTKLEHERTILESTEKFKHWYYNDGNIYAIGNGTSDLDVGPYQYYYANGRLMSEGTYDTNGVKTGLWKYYHENGQFKASENFVNGNVEGTIDTYNSDGTLKSSSGYTNDKLDGFWKSYHVCGSLKEQYPYSQGVGDGEGKVYYETGELKITYAVKEDQFDGEYLMYYKNGTVSNEYLYKEGKLNGTYKSYHPNGSIAESGQYEDGELAGEWITYFVNKNMESKGSYSNGEPVGFWEYFYSNGSTRLKENYNEQGQLDGITKWYDIDNKVYCERTLKSDLLVGYKFFDKTGKVLVENANNKGNMKYVGYYATGDIFSKGILIQGVLEGEYITYHYNGKINNQGQMKNGLWHGPLKKYHKSGKLERESNFNAGLLTGYYRSYYLNGRIEEEGWLEDDNIQQKWLEYFINGSVKSETYYSNGKVNEIKYYDPKGKLSSIEYFEKENLMGYEQYDTLGNLFNRKTLSIEADTLRVKKASGELAYVKIKKCGQDYSDIIYYTNGKEASKYIMQNGELTKYISYGDNTEILVEGNFLVDLRHGNWNFFYENGLLKYESTYLKGNREGEAIAYYEDGQIESKCTYYQDERHGPCTYYAPKGEIQIVKHYLRDYGPFAYQYKLSDGTMSDTVVIDKKSQFQIKGYFPNGKPSLTQNYENGYFQGENTFYDDNGNITDKTSYKMGLSHGPSIKYFPNGQVKFEENYYYNVQHGPEKYYYSNGQLKEIINWYYGSREGWSRKYDQDGILLKEIFYRNDIEY